MKSAIGLIIKQISEEKKLSVAKLAAKMSKSRPHIYNCFVKQNMSDEERVEWADALGVTVEEIDSRWKATEVSDKPSMSPESAAFAQDTVDRIIGELKAQYETRLSELKAQYESRIAELKDQTGDLREQLKFNREMVQAFKEGHLGKSEGAIIRPLHIAARA